MTSHLLHVALKDRTRDAVELRLWTDNENNAEVRDLSRATLQPLLDRAERDYYTLSDEDGAAVGQQLFRWINGDDQILANALRGVPAGGGAVVLCLALEKGLAERPAPTGGRTRSGSPTSPTCPPGKAGATPPWSSSGGAAASSAGPPAKPCTPASPCAPCAWPAGTAGHPRAWSTRATAACNTPPRSTAPNWPLPDWRPA